MFLAELEVEFFHGDLNLPEISNWRGRLPIGDLPGYFRAPDPDYVIGDFPDLSTVAQFEPLSRAFV
jgi:hypothetical protein